MKTVHMMNLQGEIKMLRSLLLFFTLFTYNLAAQDSDLTHKFFIYEQGSDKVHSIALGFPSSGAFIPGIERVEFREASFYEIGSPWGYFIVDGETYSYPQFNNMLLQAGITFRKFDDSDVTFEDPEEEPDGFAPGAFITAFGKLVHVKDEAKNIITGNLILNNLAPGTTIRFEDFKVSTWYDDKNDILYINDTDYRLTEQVSNVYNYLARNTQYLNWRVLSPNRQFLRDGLHSAKDIIKTIARGYVDILTLLAPGGQVVDFVVTLSDARDAYKKGDNLGALISVLPAALLSGRVVGSSTKIVGAAGATLGHIPNLSKTLLHDIKIAWAKGEVKFLDFTQKLFPAIRACDDIQANGILGSLLAKVYCLEKGTLVLTNKGQKPIEKLQYGDSVFSYNIDGRREEVGVVFYPLHYDVEGILEITVENQLGDLDKIRCTEAHSFYRKGEYYGEWTDAVDLVPGDVIHCRNNTKVTVISNKFYNDKTTVYSIAVPGNNNYFAGKFNLLTHNHGCYKTYKEAVLEQMGRSRNARLNAFDFIEAALDNPAVDNATFISNMRTLSQVGDLGDKLKIKDSLRRTRPLHEPAKKAFGKKGLHEWLPVNNIEIIFQTAKSEVEIRKALKAMRDFRTPTRAIITKGSGANKVKYVHSLSKGMSKDLKLGGPWKDLHDALDDLFLDHWGADGSGFVISDWKEDLIDLMDNIPGGGKLTSPTADEIKALFP